MEQKGSLSFELHLSTSNNPANNSYVIHLSIDLGQVKISKKINNRTTIINETMDRDFVLHEGKNKYWLSIDHANLLLKYGQGEVRDRSTLIRSDVTKAEKDLVRQIEFVHVTFNNSNILANYEWYEYKVKLKIGQYPVTQDPALLVAESKDANLDDFINNSVMLISRLDKPCQSLYYDTVHWKLQDDTFSHFYEAIERSVQNETG
ncbi:unnamed protein product [Rotaria magnacalcarata]|uniref:Uncharacterized protein n=1 Tax=Rotaria magnacalcarata TaxID=392030 RepID=A0A814EFZ1_9BILA|nr:unnamed protein product [Rotaria magnacalcarata]CAF1416560.1 unnamed protein product [Rotaria magnacalcarata]